MNAQAQKQKEFTASVMNGWLMLPLPFILIISAVWIFAHAAGRTHNPGMIIVTAVGLIILAILIFTGFFTLQPNEARLLVLFGSYKGTVRRSGFHWANPFYSRGIKWEIISTGSNFKVSLRLHNFAGEKLKVNDKAGNPIEIAAVVVWRIEDTAKAFFDVDNYRNYVVVQSESAVRHLASSFRYDHGENDEVTLRSGGDEISNFLLSELESRLSKAGVVVEEARLTHLAYAPEIASSMLRRQQAEAVIAARKTIVRGAVSMVEDALRELEDKRIIEMDAERKAAMVGNLLVVLCGESEAHPVINAGTLYP